MYKTLCVTAILLGLFALTGSKSVAVPNAAFSSPLIVAKVMLTNQTEALPATTVLTVPQTGIYRISAYMITTSSTSVDHYKYLNLSWSDEAGAESNYYFLVTDAVDGPPSAYGFGGFGGTPENNFTVRAVAGTPIAYSVTVDGYGPGGTYDLFIVVERLI